MCSRSVLCDAVCARGYDVDVVVSMVTVDAFIVGFVVVCWWWGGVMTWHQVLLVVFAEPIVVVVGKWVGVGGGWSGRMIGLLLG